MKRWLFRALGALLFLLNVAAVGAAVYVYQTREDAIYAVLYENEILDEPEATDASADIEAAMPRFRQRILACGPDGSCNLYFGSTLFADLWSCSLDSAAPSQPKLPAGWHFVSAHCAEEIQA